MQTIKSLLLFLLICSLLSCHHDKPVRYRNRIAEDLNYRIGKWYSVSNDTIHFSKLDTIWFINDTMAGWTGFAADPHQFVFRKTYFVNTYYLYRLFPNVDTPTKTDTIIQQCAMNATQDTLGLYWSDGFHALLLEQYVKKPN